jgi:hypothetical protein
MNITYLSKIIPPYQDEIHPSEMLKIDLLNLKTSIVDILNKNYQEKSNQVGMTRLIMFLKYGMMVDVLELLIIILIVLYMNLKTILKYLMKLVNTPNPQDQ